MQAARRVLASAGLLAGAGRRCMSGGVSMTPAQIAAEAKQTHGSIVDTLGLYTITPLAVGVFIYDVFIAHEEEFEGQIPPYPYMRIRTRTSFPWGTEMGLFEVHQHVPSAN